MSGLENKNNENNRVTESNIISLAQKNPDYNEPQSSKSFAFDSLESVRKKLLDLTGKNTLLNYKHSKTNSIRLIDELPNQIFQTLSEGKKLCFLSVPEPTENELIDTGYIQFDKETGDQICNDYPSAEQWAKHLNLNTSYELPPPETIEVGEKRHQDNRLQTLLYSSEMEARLRGIRNKAQTAIEETGGNILYLTIGFIEWYESRDSDRVRIAPLFTLPVNLEKQKLDKSQGVYLYEISLKDEGLLSNITLSEKLQYDFGLKLPEIDEEINPEDYFNLIEETILKHQSRWHLRRYMTLALLNYSKQVMYLDLDPERWPDDAQITDHEIVRMFFGQEEGSSGGFSNN